MCSISSSREGPLKPSTCVTFKAFLVVIVAPAKVTWILNGFHCDAPNSLSLVLSTRHCFKRTISRAYSTEEISS